MPANAIAPFEAGALLHDPAKLVAWRTEAGLTRAAVSREVPISYSWLRDLEHGRSSPSLPMLDRLARYFGHEPGELVAKPEPC